MIITIPLDNNQLNTNLNTLDSLNLDLWNLSLNKGNEYIPKDFKTDQQKVFEFSNLMFIIKKDQPNYYFYLGSNTTPPCHGIISFNSDNVYHLVVNTPLKISLCQFKILRENTLFSNSAKVIHSRLDQPTNKRKVFVIPNKNFAFNPSVENYIPKEFFELAEEIDGESLLPEKLSTISKLKAIKKTRKLIKTGGRLTKKFKYTKKGVKMIRKGLNIKKIAIKKYGKGILKGKKKRGPKGKGSKGKKKKSSDGITKFAKNIVEKGVSSGEYGSTHSEFNSGSDENSEEINC